MNKHALAFAILPFLATPILAAESKLLAEARTLPATMVPKLLEVLNEEIDKKQRQMLQSKDSIKKSATELQAEAIKQLAGTPKLENIMTFSFEIA